MNKTKIACIACAHEMVRMKARGYKGDTYTGAYCPECKLIVDDKGIPLVPVSAIVALDPELQKADPAEAYKAIVEVFRSSHLHTSVASTHIDINKYLKIRTREPGTREPPRLDREKFRSDLREELLS